MGDVVVGADVHGVGAAAEVGGKRHGAAVRLKHDGALLGLGDVEVELGAEGRVHGDEADAEAVAEPLEEVDAGLVLKAGADERVGEDEGVDAYFVPWNSEEETTNSYQHSEILDDGSLLVNIAEDVDEEELKYIRMLHKTNV